MKRGLLLMASLLAVLACGGDERGGPDGSGPGQGGTGTGGSGGAGGTGGDGGSAGTGGTGGTGGAGGTGDECPLGAICEGIYNYAFVTSAAFAGDRGGRAGADRICNDHASAAGLPGTYRAFLTSSDESAAERLQGASGWLRTDRRPFLNAREDVLADRIRYPLLLDERAEPSAHVGAVVMVGSADQNCGDWTLTSGRVPGGYLGFSGWGWRTGALGQCDIEAPILCFGIDHEAPLPEASIEGRRAFVTLTAFSPDSSRAKADELCADEASAAGLEGSFKALLATSDEAPIDRFSLEGPTWVRTDGTMLWEKAEHAAARPPLAALVLGADGETIRTNHWVYVGSASLTEVGAATCDDWSDATDAEEAGMGFANRAVGWLGTSKLTCQLAKDFGAGVFCLEE